MEVIQNQFPESQFEKLNKIANEIDGSITANELSIWINELKNVQTDYERVMIPQCIENFDLMTTIEHIISPEIFSLSLNRIDKTKSLYGIEHVRLRQKIWNTLPKNTQIKWFNNKLEFEKIKYQMTRLLGRPSKADPEIVAVKDIGKAHTIYKLDVIQSEKAYSYVLKKEWANVQRFFEAVCIIFGKAMIASYPIFTKDKAYTLLNYVPGVPLHKIKWSEIDSEKMIDECAFQAAIGDCLGRGDRHFENYLWAKDNLYPIDITYMFDDKHHHWLYTYTAGGMYEINSVYNLFHTAQDKRDALNVFKQAYVHWFTKIQDRQSELKRLIQAYFPGQFEQYITYITDAFKKADMFLDIYDKGIIEYDTRLKWRKRLEGLISKSPIILEHEPLFKMMHFAHEDRPIAFYKLEMMAPDILRKIQKYEENGV